MSGRKILITHPIHPGQFGAVAHALARAGDEVTFLSRVSDPGDLPYRLIQYRVLREPTTTGNAHLMAPEHAILIGQAVARTALSLKKAGYCPDLIIGPAGFGELAFLPDLFPGTPVLAYAEYFYRSWGADVGFDPDTAIPQSELPRVRLKNALTLATMDLCTSAYAPTQWQKQTFPAAYHAKIDVIHDGIDTEVLRPAARRPLTIRGMEVPTRGRRLITYAARSLEHYRGVHKFWPAAAQVLARNPDVEVLIVGEDQPAYGQGDGTRLAEQLFASHPADVSRVHAVPALARDAYIRMLQVSDCHIYLTYPFIPSWSLVEALSCGAPVIAADVAPVRELVGEETCSLVDFFDVNRLSATIELYVRTPGKFREMRQRARQRAVQTFDFEGASWPRLSRLMAKLVR